MDTPEHQIFLSSLGLGPQVGAASTLVQSVGPYAPPTSATPVGARPGTVGVVPRVNLQMAGTLAYPTGLVDRHEFGHAGTSVGFAAGTPVHHAGPVYPPMGMFPGHQPGMLASPLPMPPALPLPQPQPDRDVQPPAPKRGAKRAPAAKASDAFDQVATLAVQKVGLKQAKATAKASARAAAGVKHFQWTDDSLTEALLEYHAEFTAAGLRASQLYEKIADKISFLNNGNLVLSQQVKDRYNNVRKSTQAIRDHDKRTGVTRFWALTEKEQRVALGTGRTPLTETLYNKCVEHFSKSDAYAAAHSVDPLRDVGNTLPAQGGGSTSVAKAPAGAQGHDQPMTQEEIEAMMENDPEMREAAAVDRARTNLLDVNEELQKEKDGRRAAKQNRTPAASDISSILAAMQAAQDKRDAARERRDAALAAAQESERADKKARAAEKQEVMHQMLSVIAKLLDKKD